VSAKIVLKYINTFHSFYNTCYYQTIILFNEFGPSSGPRAVELLVDGLVVETGERKGNCEP
jgi:hypothetical protein